MARIDGLIILDPNGKPIITSHFPLHPPSYPSIHIDAYNHASKLAEAEARALDPIIWVNNVSSSSTIPARIARRNSLGERDDDDDDDDDDTEDGQYGNKHDFGSGPSLLAGAGLCHLEREGLRFLAPVSNEVNPLFALSFLECFLETLHEYLGEVTEISLKDNFDIVYMLIEEMLDEGHPMTMETNMLKEVVLPPTLMRKLLKAAGVSGLQTPTTAPFTAPIPWRRSNVRHTNNEIYFDVEESLDAIVDRKGSVLSSVIWGRINCNSRLSGNPDLLLTFGNPKVMANCSFHPCIRYSRWEANGALSFIPPDGHFQLMKYESATKPVLPFTPKASLQPGEGGGKFSLTLASRTNHRPLEDVVVSIHLGQGASSVSATATGDKRSAGMGPNGLSGRSNDAVVEGHVGGGTWEFDPNTSMLKWTLASLTSKERPATLTGSYVTSNPQSIPSPSFTVKYLIQHHTYSNLKVEQLKVTGDVLYKPFKGVKMTSKAGKVEVRW